MVDFANAKQNLARTFSTQETGPASFEVTELQPVEMLGKDVLGTDNVSTAIRRSENRTNSLAPQTFDPSMSVVLSDRIKDSVAETRAAQQVARDTKRSNNASMLQTLLEANKNISDAEDKIATANGIPFSRFVGIFDEDFNVPKQKARIKKAQERVIQQGKLSAMKQQNSLLAVEDAQAPLKEFESLQKAKKGLLDNVSAQMAAISASNTALKDYRDFAFDLASPADISEIEKSGNYDQVFSRGAIKRYKDKERKRALDIRGAELANAQNDLELKTQFEDRVLEQTSQFTLESLVADAKKNNDNNIKISDNLSLSIQKAESAIIKKSETNQKRIEEVNKFSDMNIKNINGFSSAMRDVSAVSSVNNTSGVPVNVDGFNLKNTTVESLQTFDFEAIHPAIRQETADVMIYSAQLNAQESVTREDVQRQMQKLKVLEDKTVELKKMQVENAPDDQTAKVISEMHTNGRISNGKNASAMSLNLIGMQPNFGGDTSLVDSFDIFKQNIIDAAGGGAGAATFVDEDGNIDINAMMSASIKTGRLSKTAIVQNAMLKKNDNGLTPVAAYANGKSANLMWAGLQELGQTFPEVKQKFFEAADDTGSLVWIDQYGGQDHGAVALELAGLAKLDEKQQELGVNYLNAKLMEILNRLIQENTAQWNAQINPQRGSFMVNMFTNGPPSEVVDNAIQYSYFNNVNAAWDAKEIDPQAKKWDVSEKLSKWSFR